MVGEKEETEREVARIHATELSVSDVMGNKLPPNPENPDATVVGIDENENGIRDDVELAIFAEYPNSARTRAVLLQYALALQRQAVLPIINTETVIASVQEEDRAFVCIGEIIHRDDFAMFDRETELLTDFVKNKQLNTPERKQNRTEFYEKIDSYSSLTKTCDIELSTLPN
mgnify:FL=1